MTTNSNQLLEELCAIIHSNIKFAKNFKELDINILNRKPSVNAWSILECLEHLNRYAAFYLPEIEKHLNGNDTNAARVFKSGFIGNYLVKMVIPGKNSKKMKTFSDMNPSGSSLKTDVVDAFIASQLTLLKQLEKAKNLNINKAGIPVTFTALIKLKLGDALRFMVYHNQRHVEQALRNHY